MTESVVVKANSQLVKEAENIVKIAKNEFGLPIFNSVKDFVDFSLKTSIERFKAEAKIVKKEQSAK